MKFARATRQYERWLGERVDLVRPDLQHKHRVMAASLFVSFRGAFYRWAQRWPQEWPELAIRESHLTLGPARARRNQLDGYRAGLDSGGRPFALGEHHGALREMATRRLRDPKVFWEKLAVLPRAENGPPGAARALVAMLPARTLKPRFATRVAGVGSLGRRHIVALADWRGGSSLARPRPWRSPRAPGPVRPRGPAWPSTARSSAGRGAVRIRS